MCDGSRNSTVKRFWDVVCMAPHAHVHVNMSRCGCEPANVIHAACCVAGQVRHEAHALLAVLPGLACLFFVTSTSLRDASTGAAQTWWPPSFTASGPSPSGSLWPGCLGPFGCGLVELLCEEYLERVAVRRPKRDTRFAPTRVTLKGDR